MEDSYPSLKEEMMAQPCNRRLSMGLAKTQDEVRAAQRLRYEVFAEECGASLSSIDQDIDQDELDEYCDHLIVRDLAENRVVGTYRILTSWKAQEAGKFYSQDEFDLRNLMTLVPRIVEVGRSCIRQGYREGAVITLLWSGLARYMMTRRYEYLMGCASIRLDDGGITASRTYLTLKAHCLAPEQWRVFPRVPFPVKPAAPIPFEALPPLIKGYVRLGAYVCGELAWDCQFNTADLLMFLPLSKMNPRYARHFMGRSCSNELSAA